MSYMEANVKNVTIQIGSYQTTLALPRQTQVVRMNESRRVSNPAQALVAALDNPIDSPAFCTIAREKLLKAQQNGAKSAQATILISDNTRPVPYIGEGGLLLPLIRQLLEVGYQSQDILLLIATGTHRAMSQTEIANMLGPEVLESGVAILNHDCQDQSSLVTVGTTKRGTVVELNRHYVEADLKIATGLVESHFMAGVSGGRKAVCPGILSEKGTYIFHGATLMADANSRDLNVIDNPVHSEALEVAQMVGIDFLLNVTVDAEFEITGVFAGNFVTAHEAATEYISEGVHVAVEAGDVVITHGGFVGMNHYQCAKCGVAGLGAVRPGGYMIMLANTTDENNPIGSLNYRTALALLKVIGPEKFLSLIQSPSWTFIPEQWQVQQWAKVFLKIGADHLYFYAPQMDDLLTSFIPAVDGRKFLQSNEFTLETYSSLVQAILEDIAQKERKAVEDLSVIYIADGPYVIPRAI